jgi:hypothetical protein
MWKSIAVWPKGTCDFSNNVSTDTHYTKEEAEVVCKLLRNRGFGGQYEIFPLSTRVEEIKDKEIT